MSRGRAIVLLALVGLLSPALSGCKKKPAPKEGEPTASQAPREAARRPPPPGEPRRGAVRSAAEACAAGARPDRGVSKEQFEVTVKAPREAKVGEAALIELLVTPKAGYKINLKYPTELTLKRGGDGFSLTRDSFERAHAKELNEARLRYEVTLTASTPGLKVVTGELGFSVCTPKVCITEPDLCVAWEVTAR